MGASNPHCGLFSVRDILAIELFPQSDIMKLIASYGLYTVQRTVMAQKNNVDGRYAIIETGGKQYQALEGKTLGIEKLDLNEGDSVSFDRVLLRKNGEEVHVGQPYLKIPVQAKVLKHIRGPKLTVFKFKRRKKYMRKKGHRQPITVVRIESI